MLTVATAVALCCGLAKSADWLMVRGDQQHSGWQPNEKQLNERSVVKMRLLWKQQFSRRVLSDPVMLGPIVTDHGIKELVFVRDGANVYAVDADLGTIFWTRSLAQPGADGGLTHQNCEEVGRINPVMNWSSEETKPVPVGDDEYSNGNRPLYVMGANGQVHVLRPRTGADLLPAFPLVPPSDVPANLTEKDGTLYAAGSDFQFARAGNCRATTPDRVWSRTVGISGLDLGPVAEAVSPEGANAVASFDWNGSKWALRVNASGEPILRALEGELNPLSGAGVATFQQDAAGERWIYATVADSVVAYHVKAGADAPVSAEVWRLPIAHGGAPVVANGVVYFVAQSSGKGASHQVLHAVDARTGTELFQSHDEITGELPAGNLALANGHVCFSTRPATLRCFGLPFTM